MSIFDDIKYQQSKITRNPSESDYSLAKRLFGVQMEVYSANSGSDLYTVDSFDRLGVELQNKWIETARKL